MVCWDDPPRHEAVAQPIVCEHSRWH
jgi:hypothetical protein